MEDMRNVHRILVKQPKGKRPFGSSRHRYKATVKEWQYLLRVTLLSHLLRCCPCFKFEKKNYKNNNESASIFHSASPCLEKHML